MNIFNEILTELADYEEIVSALKQNISPVNVTGAGEGVSAHLTFALSESLGARCLFVTSNDVSARNLIHDLNFYTNGNVLFFPKSEMLFYDVEAAGRDIISQRLNVIDRLHDKKNKCHIVTTVDSLQSVTIPCGSYNKYVRTITVGDDINPEEFVKNLVILGYSRQDPVEGKGQFSIRGGIIDFYPYYSEMPYRIELFDTEVESIRLFEAENQRTIDKVDSVRITPASEIILEDETRARLIEKLSQTVLQIEKVKEKSEGQLNLLKILNRDIERLKENISFPSVHKYIPYIYEEKTTILDYMKDALVVFDEPARIHESGKTAAWELNETVTELAERGVLAENAGGYNLDYHELISRVLENKLVGLSAISHASPDYRPKKLVSFTSKGLNEFHGKMEFFYDALKFYKDNKYRIIILGGTSTRAKNLAQQLNDEEIYAHYFDEPLKLPESGKITVTRGSLNRGFEYPLIRTVIISDKEIFGSERKKGKSVRKTKQNRIDSFTDLNIGDFIVHQNHGIGEYIGIKKLEVEGKTRDYLQIKFRGDDFLYVPTDQLNFVYKYIGKDGVSVKLNKLGGTEWNKAKQRVKESCADMAKELLELYAQRENAEGISFSADNEWQKQFEENFPYDETDDQLRSIEEVKQDMENKKPMDRLLCGDVGYGKTEVALRAAFKAVMDGYQVAYLVPTTILANQHFNTFRQRMKDYPITVEMMSRFRSPAEQKETLKRLKSGEVDIVIGTHRIIQKDMEFKKLGLLIIDEEQRFGVAHKEKIKEVKKNVDVLTLTATPIPRTLHMSLAGIRDMSVIEQPPKDRYPVATYVLEYDNNVIRDALAKEVGRGGQVFYLFNRVQGIYRIASRISEMLPGARVAVAHGQMNEGELESIMLDFISGDIDILVCTTIIETGLDVSNVNTIIIEDADRMGLSQLYQLRGRVGRSNRLAYAYLTFKRDKVLNEIAEKRLKAVKEFTEFGSGFKIALRDLEIRGAGSVIGVQQHGHMDAVGYDMYCKLLDLAVKELRGGEIQPEIETLINLQIDAHIPEKYIRSHNLRIEGYKKIASISNQEEFYDIFEELEDRYGEVPACVNNLMEISLIKSMANALKFTEVKEINQYVGFYFSADNPPDMQRIVNLLEKYPDKITMNRGNKPNIRYKLDRAGDIKYLSDIKKILSEI